MFAGISYPPIPIYELGPVALSLHGLFAAVGFAAGAWLFYKYTLARGYDGDQISSIITWALVGALLGTRGFTIPADLAQGAGLADIFSLRGSFSILGGFAGGVLGGGIRLRMLGLPFWKLADLAAPGMALGTVIGRIGDLAIVEHLGKPTDFFLGYTWRPGYPPPAPQHAEIPQLCIEQGICTFHHAALYDLLGAAVLLWVLFRLGARWKRRYAGQLFAFWGLWYGYQRFLIDFTRHTDLNADRMLGPLTWSQWSGLALGVLGMALIWWLEGRGPEVEEPVEAEQPAVEG